MNASSGNSLLVCAASKGQKERAILRGEWGFRRQILIQHELAGPVGIVNEKDLCVCELEKVLEVSGNIEEYFKLRKQYIHFS